MEARRRHRILRILKEYGVIQFTILAIIFLVTDYFISIQIYATAKNQWQTTLQDKAALLVDIGLIGFWLYLYCCFIRDKIYFNLTDGRKYTKDNARTGKDFFYLLQFYRHEAEEHKLNIKQFPVATWREIKGLPLAQVGKRCVCIPSTEQTNFTLTGAPGCGKTQTAEACAITHEGSVVFVDVKGVSHLNKPGRNIKRFCPEDPDYKTESCHFNPLKGLESMTLSQKKLYLTEMANILIPDEPGSDGNFFPSRARKAFIGIVFLLLDVKPEGKTLTFPAVVHNILQNNIFGWINKVKESDCTEAKEQIAAFDQASEKNIAGVYDALCTALAPFSNEIFDYLLDDKGDQIGVEMLDNGADLYLQIKQEHLTAMAPIITMILNSLMRDFMNRPDSASGIKTRNILVVLDEFPQLTFSYDMANTYLSTLRSKNVQIMLVFQSIKQLKYKYRDGAEALIGNCNYQLIFKCNDVESRTNYSKLIGTHQVLRVSDSAPNKNASEGHASKNVSIVREPVFQPEDFGDLEDEVIIYFDGKYLRGKKIVTYK